MSAEAYRITWALYVCGAIGLLIVFWRMTTGLRADWLRQPLRVLVSVWLLLPCPVDKGYSEWAPALLMFAFEGIFGGAEGAMRTGKPLLMMSGLALLAAALPLMWLNHYRRQGLLRQQEDMEATRVYRELVDDSHRHSDRYSDRSSDRNVDRSWDRYSDRSSDRNADRSWDRYSDRNSDRSIDRNADRSSDRYSDRRVDRGSDRYSASHTDRYSPSRSDRYSDNRSDSYSASRSGSYSASHSDRESERLGEPSPKGKRRKPTRR